MAQDVRKAPRRARTDPFAEERSYQSLDFAKKNWILFGAGLVSIALGFALLAAGDISFAPILLVAGYLGFIPWAMVSHTRRSGTSGNDAEGE